MKQFARKVLVLILSAGMAACSTTHRLSGKQIVQEQILLAPGTKVTVITKQKQELVVRIVEVTPEALIVRRSGSANIVIPRSDIVSVVVKQKDRGKSIALAAALNALALGLAIYIDNALD